VSGDLAFCKLEKADFELDKRKDQRPTGDGVINGSQEATRGCVWKLFYLLREVSLGRMRWGIMKGLLLEAVTASGSATSHFIDVSLVYWKTPAHLEAEFIIGTAETLPGQQGASKNE